MKFVRNHKWILLFGIALILALGLTVSSLIFPGFASVPANILGSAAKPVRSALTAAGEFLLGTDGRIETLTAENERLRRWAADIEEKARLYEQTAAENERLRVLLEFAERRRDLKFTPADIISRDLDNYARTFTIGRGTADGLQSGMAAVSAEGHLAGIIKECGDNWSLVRSVTDADFVCGAYAYLPMVESVCEGRFDLMRRGLTAFSGLTDASRIKNGDVLLTTGVGDLYPRDIVIGTVESVEPDPGGMTLTATVRPAVDLSALTQVFLITAFEIVD